GVRRAYAVLPSPSGGGGGGGGRTTPARPAGGGGARGGGWGGAHVDASAPTERSFVLLSSQQRVREPFVETTERQASRERLGLRHDTERRQLELQHVGVERFAQHPHARNCAKAFVDLLHVQPGGEHDAAA